MSRLRFVCCLAVLAAAAACQTAPPARPHRPRRRSSSRRPRPGGASPRSATPPRSTGWPTGGARRWPPAGRRISRAGSPREGELLDPRSPARAGRSGAGNLPVPIRPAGRAKMGELGAGYCYVGVEAGQLTLATELRGLRFGGYLWEVKGGERLVFLGGAVAGRRQDSVRLWRGSASRRRRAGRADRRVPLPADPSGARAGGRAHRRRAGRGAPGLTKKKAARRRPFPKSRAAQQLPGWPSAQSVVDSTSFAAPRTVLQALRVRPVAMKARVISLRMFGLLECDSAGAWARTASQGGREMRGRGTLFRAAWRGRWPSARSGLLRHAGLTRHP